jgi:hypothetical protein
LQSSASICAVTALNVWYWIAPALSGATSIESSGKKKENGIPPGELDCHAVNLPSLRRAGGDQGASLMQQNFFAQPKVYEFTASYAFDKLAIELTGAISATLNRYS